jgi:hypothetical protein
MGMEVVSIAGGGVRIVLRTRGDAVELFAALVAAGVRGVGGDLIERLRVELSRDFVSGAS